MEYKWEKKFEFEYTDWFNTFTSNENKIIYDFEKKSFLVKKLNILYGKYSTVVNNKNLNVNIFVIENINGYLIFFEPITTKESFFLEWIEKIENFVFKTPLINNDIKRWIKSFDFIKFNSLALKNEEVTFGIPLFGSLFIDNNYDIKLLYINNEGISNDPNDIELKEYEKNVERMIKNPFFCVYLNNDTKMYSVVPSVHNPFKSEKQRAYFWWRATKGKDKKKWEKIARRWEKHTKRKKKKKKKKRKKKK